MSNDPQEEHLIDCGDTLDMSNVETIRDAVVKSFDEYQLVALDLKDVATFDTAGLQLLAACQAEAEQSNVTWRVHEMPPAMKALAALIDL